MKKLTTDLMVKDVNKTVDFYREILGIDLSHYPHLIKKEDIINELI